MKKLSAAAVVCGAAVLLSLAYAADAPRTRPGGRVELHRPNSTMMLLHTVFRIDQLDKIKGYSLTPEQAKKTLDILKPLRSKSKLTQDEAKKKLDALNGVLTASQTKQMAKIKPVRPSTRKSATGGKPESASKATRRPPPHRPPADFNPFYSKNETKDDFVKELKKRLDEFFSGMEKKAKQVKKKASSGWQSIDTAA